VCEGFDAAPSEWAFVPGMRFVAHVVALETPRVDWTLLRSEASALTALGAGWSLLLSNVVECDSDPPAWVRRRDSVWIRSLPFDF
jgi:hypothetical protein